MSAGVLIVVDDPQAATHLTNILVRRYEVQAARHAEAAMAMLRSWHPALAVTEREMPIVDGVELCRRIRESSNVPVIVIASASDGPSEVAALDAGADDYIKKPFGIDALLARVRAALRRGSDITDTPALGVGEFHIDFNDRRVHVHGQPVRLTPKEFDLFVYMARHPNRVSPHRTLPRR